jgi:hypothetical protein
MQIIQLLASFSEEEWNLLLKKFGSEVGIKTQLNEVIRIFIHEQQMKKEIETILE